MVPLVLIHVLMDVKTLVKVVHRLVKMIVKVHVVMLVLVIVEVHALAVVKVVVKVHLVAVMFGMTNKKNKRDGIFNTIPYFYLLVI